LPGAWHSSNLVAPTLQGLSTIALKPAGLANQPTARSTDSAMRHAVTRSLIAATVIALLLALIASTALADHVVWANSRSATNEQHVVMGRVVDCHTWAYYPNVLISSARNMSCRAARREMKRYKRPISRSFTTPDGFSCSRVSGGSLGGQWRCVRGTHAFRFEFGD
jgi:hypothetical protein